MVVWRWLRTAVRVMQRVGGCGIVAEGRATRRSSASSSSRRRHREEKAPLFRGKVEIQIMWGCQATPHRQNAAPPQNAGRGWAPVYRFLACGRTAVMAEAKRQCQRGYRRRIRRHGAATVCGTASSSNPLVLKTGGSKGWRVNMRGGTAAGRKYGVEAGSA
jgi:hypothetical protein